QRRDAVHAGARGEEIEQVFARLQRLRLPCAGEINVARPGPVDHAAQALLLAERHARRPVPAPRHAHEADALRIDVLARGERVEQPAEQALGADVDLDRCFAGAGHVDREVAEARAEVAGTVLLDDVLLVGVEAADAHHERRGPRGRWQLQIGDDLLPFERHAQHFDRRLGERGVGAEGGGGTPVRLALALRVLRWPCAEAVIAPGVDVGLARFGTLACGLRRLRGGEVLVALLAPRARPFVAIERVDAREHFAHFLLVVAGERVGVAVHPVLHRLLELGPGAGRSELRGCVERDKGEQGNQHSIWRHGVSSTAMIGPYGWRFAAAVLSQSALRQRVAMNAVAARPVAAYNAVQSA